MIKYSIKNNSIIINGISINLTRKIRQVYEYDNKLIILQDFKETNNDNEPNVVCYDSNGTLIWEIDLIKGDNNKYIRIKEECGALILIDDEHFKYVVDANNGKFIKERIMYLKDISDDSKTLLTKVNYIQLFIIAIILFLILFYSKNFFVSSYKYIENKTKNENSSKESTNSSKNSIGDDLTNLKNIIDEELPDRLKNKNYNSDNESNKDEHETINTTQEVQTIEPTNIQEESIEEVKNRNNENNQDSKNNEDDKYEGINKFVGIIDDVGTTISNGDKKTIDDVNGSLIECTVASVIDNCRFTAIYNGEEITMKLIGIEKSNVGKEYLDALLPIDSKIYIEQDTKKTNSLDEYLVYAWAFPTTDDKNNMVNYFLIHNGYANFELQTPNIRYNYYFQK